MNPFLTVNVGIFVASGSLTLKPAMPEQICSAIANRILTNVNTLDLAYWEECVGMIPHQVTERNVSISQETDTLSLSDIATQCISKNFQSTSSVDLTRGIKKLLSNLEQINKVNSLSISFSKNEGIQISLAMMDVIRKPNSKMISLSGNLAETTINYRNQKNKEDLEAIFGQYNLITNQQYYISVLPDE